jgi:nitrogen permease regulator 2-like protein
VPLIDLGYKDKMEGNWDLTMRKVVPFINGVDHVKKIAAKADADLGLVKECMAQVMYVPFLVGLRWALTVSVGCTNAS